MRSGLNVKVDVKKAESQCPMVGALSDWRAGSSTTLTRLSPIDVMVKQRAVGQGTDHTVSRRGARAEWRRGITLFFSCILAFFAIET